jgi:hypothetical protein
MRDVIRSLVKPYSAGIVSETRTLTVDVPATIDTEHLVLSASRALWIGTIALIGTVLVAVSIALAKQGDDRVPFDLENIRNAIIADPM